MAPVPIGLPQMAAMAIGLLVYALGTWFNVREEERLLRARFGAAYLAYAARVPRFVPGLF